MHYSRSRQRNKQASIMREKIFFTLCISILFTLILIITNIQLSKKTYEIINLKAKTDKLLNERVELKETTDNLLSPTRIRNVAIDKFKMEPINDISEIINIQP